MVTGDEGASYPSAAGGDTANTEISISSTYIRQSWEVQTDGTMRLKEHSPKVVKLHLGIFKSSLDDRRCMTIDMSRAKLNGKETILSK